MSKEKMERDAQCIRDALQGQYPPEELEHLIEVFNKDAARGIVHILKKDGTSFSVVGDTPDDVHLITNQSFLSRDELVAIANTIILYKKALDLSGGTLIKLLGDEELPYHILMMAEKALVKEGLLIMDDSVPKAA